MRVLHHNQTKNRISQQSRDFRQASSESDVKRSRQTFDFK